METENLPPTESPSFFDSLRRSTSDRMVAGVSGGLAAQWRVDPVIIRIGFVVLTFVGLAGVILYGVLWLVVAEDGADRSIAGRSLGLNDEHQLRNAALIVAVFVAVAIVVGDSSWGMFWATSWLVLPALALYWFFVIRPKQGVPMTQPTPADHEPTVVMTPPPPPPGEPKSYAIVGITLSVAAIAVGVIAMLGLTRGGIDHGPGLINAVVLAIVGLGLVIGAWRGDAGWLIPVGLIASFGLILSFGLSSIFGNTWGSAWVAPDRGHEVESTYDHGLGEFTLDLSAIPADELAGHTVTIDNGMGVTRVYVPSELVIEVDAELTGGQIDLFGRTTDGTSISGSYTTPGSAAPKGTGSDRLTLEINQLFGQIEVDHR